MRAKDRKYEWTERNILGTFATERRTDAAWCTFAMGRSKPRAKSRFEGQMTKNKMHGQGLMLWADGSYFSGEFKNGLISGYGQYVHNA